MDLKISKRELPINFCIMWICMLGIFDSVTNQLISNQIRIFICVAVLAYLLCRVKIRRFPALIADIIIAVSVVVYCNNNIHIKTINSFGFLRYFLVFALLFVGRYIEYLPDKIIRFYLPFSLFHVFATIFLRFNRSFYFNYVLRMYTGHRRAQLISQYNNGWMPGIATHYSSNGMYLATATILVLCAFLYSQKRVEKKKYAILLGLTIIALLMTGKRAHAIFSAAAFLVIYFYHTGNQRKGRFLKYSMVICGAAVFFTIAYSLFPDLFSFIDRFSSTAETGDITLGRIETWGIVLSVFKQNPVFGIGWGQFSTLASSYSVTINAHNVYVQLLCETGIVGFSIFVTLFVVMLSKSIGIYKQMRSTGRASNMDNKAMAFSVGMQVFFLLYSFTGNPLYDAPMFIPYYLALAITIYYWCKQKYVWRYTEEEEVER